MTRNIMAPWTVLVFLSAGLTLCQEFTPLPKDVTPLSEEVTSRSGLVTSRIEEITSRPEQVTSRTEEVTSRPEQVTSRTEEVTFQTEEVTSRTEHVTSLRDDITAQPGQVTSPREEVTTQLEEVTYPLEVIQPAEEVTVSEDGETCRDLVTGETHQVGEEWYNNHSCWLHSCKSIEGVTYYSTTLCPSFYIPPDWTNCTEVTDSAASYPDCCPRPSCVH